MLKLEYSGAAAGKDGTRPHQFNRTRSSSLSSSVYSDSRHKNLPHIEGQIKWLTTVDCQSEVMCTKFSPDSSVFAVGLANGLIKIYQADTASLLHTLNDEDVAKDRLPCTSLNFVLHDSMEADTQNLLMATYASGLVKFWHYTSSSCLHTINEGRQTICSGFNASGNHFVTGGSSPQMHVYDSLTKQKLITLEASDSRDVMNGHRSRIFSMIYHPSEVNLLVSGGWDDTIQFWDDRQKHAIKRIYGPHICGDALDIDAVHNHLLTGSWRNDHVLQIWDINSGNLLKDVPQDALQKSMLYCCQWLGKDYIICGGNEQNMVRIVDRGTLNTVAQMVDLEQGVFCIDNDRSGSLPRIAIGAAQKLHLMKQEKRI